MNATQTAGFPVEIETVGRRFEQWRKGCRIRDPIPESLWAKARRLGRSIRGFSDR